jgi:hypothetical protein
VKRWIPDVRSMTAFWILSASVLAACASHGSSADASVEGPQGPQHGTIFVASGGSEVPAISPTANLELPDDAEACQSDVTVDACRIQTACNPTNVTPVAGGQITFGTTPPTTIVSTATAPGTIESHDVGEISGGQPVTFAIDGTGAVPAMSASVVAPTQVTITSNFDGVRIPATSDYVLTWTGATTGTVELDVSYGIDGDFTLVDCAFPAAPGQGTISMAALQRMPYGGLARLDVSDAATQQAGAWTIDFLVGYDAVWADGSYAQGILDVAPN